MLDLFVSNVSVTSVLGHMRHIPENILQIIWELFHPTCFNVKQVIMMSKHM
jgi:hypothetical protein